MPNRLLPILRTTFFTLIAVYVVLMISTVSFAAHETDLREAIRYTEASIATLESRYFDAADELTKTDPALLGLGAPVGKRYAREADAPVLSLLAQ